MKINGNEVQNENGTKVFTITQRGITHGYQWVANLNKSECNMVVFFLDFPNKLASVHTTRFEYEDSLSKYIQNHFPLYRGKPVSKGV